MLLLMFGYIAVSLFLFSVVGAKRSSVWQPGFHCRYNNRVHSIGDTWTATDGCNTCSCHGVNILVRHVCTENPCVVGKYNSLTTKCITVVTAAKSNRKIVEPEAKLINIERICMTAYFSGLIQALQYKNVGF